MALALCILLSLACLVFTFWPVGHLQAQRNKSQLEFLRERKDVVYDNLRDLNFEYRAGKYPEADYITQRASLEQEATAILSQIDALESKIPATTPTQSAANRIGPK
jgi:hypothetical protein